MEGDRPRHHPPALFAVGVGRPPSPRGARLIPRSAASVAGDNGASYNSALWNVLSEGRAPRVPIVYSLPPFTQNFEVRAAAAWGRTLLWAASCFRLAALGARVHNNQ